MQPAVPFALLGAATLLAVAGWTVLAAAAVALRGLRVAPLLLAAGALLLAGLEVRTATQFSAGTSDALSLLRASGALLVVAGLALGALGPPVRRRVPAPTSVAGVVVPLGAAPVPAVAAALALLAAGALLLRQRRDLAGLLLGTGLVLAAGSAALAAAADDSAAAATALLVLRAAGAAVLLAGALALGRRSLLAKVVAAILAGVLAMAAAAIGVVGTVVVNSYERQAAELVTDTAQARAAALAEQPLGLVLTGRQLQQVVLQQPAQVGAALEVVAPGEPAFVVAVPRAGDPAVLAQQGLVLSPTEVLGLRQLPAVRRALEGTVRDAQPVLARLEGSAGRLSSLVVVPALPESPAAPVPQVVVYGAPVGDEDLEVARTDEGYSVAVLSGTPLQVTATNAAPAEAAALLRSATRVLEQDLLGEGRTLAAEGDAPTLRLQPVRFGPEGAELAVLAVARSADVALAGQREALTALLVAALVTTAAVALLALGVGRRTVEPVRRLNVAAQRVAAGDLDAPPPAVSSRDEIGTLATTFATMTSALSSLTGDLRSTAVRLETVLSSMTDGLLATDAAGRVTSVNAAALAMLGLPDPALVLGEGLQDVVDVRDAAGEPLVGLALRQADAPGELQRGDGSTLPVRVALSALRDGEDEDGQGVVLVLRDTTREREVERMKTEFLSNVSHELRTPLTPIRGYADILVGKADKLTPAQVAMFSGTILAESLKMNRVVDLLVDVAALEAGRVLVAPRDVDVRELLEDRLEVWRGRAPARTGDLKRRVVAGLPPVHVDLTWLTKALDELIDNAVKYTPEGTAITLTAAPSPDGTRVRVAVRDAGPGIAEEDQRLLFTSFEQVDGSATRRVGGLGLGLSFVRRVADDAGFPLHVASAPGRGSEFALDLPLAQAGPPLPAPRRRRRAPAA